MRRVTTWAYCKDSSSTQPFPLDAHLATRTFQLDEALRQTNRSGRDQLQETRRRRGVN